LNNTSWVSGIMPMRDPQQIYHLSIQLDSPKQLEPCRVPMKVIGHGIPEMTNAPRTAFPSSARVILCVNQMGITTCPPVLLDEMRGHALRRSLGQLKYPGYSVFLCRLFYGEFGRQIAVRMSPATQRLTTYRIPFLIGDGLVTSSSDPVPNRCVVQTAAKLAEAAP
jgi:hypothetical protein